MERDKNREELLITYREKLHKQTAKEETKKQIILKTHLCTPTYFLQVLQKSIKPIQILKTEVMSVRTPDTLPDLGGFVLVRSRF